MATASVTISDTISLSVSVQAVSSSADPKDFTCEQLNNLTTGLSQSQKNGVQLFPTLLTGQTTSYASGDDGDTEIGRQTDFLTLDCNNSFGNTNRFTDELGTQVYTNNLVVDHATNLMWYKVVATADWATALSNANSSTQGGFSDWRLPNTREACTLENLGGTSARMEYAPFSYGNSNYLFWTSDTRPDNTAQAYTYRNRYNQGLCAQNNKTDTREYLICRTYRS